MIACFASNSCAVTNLTHDWWKPSLHTSPAEEIQEQDSIAGTQDFPIKFSLYIDINYKFNLCKKRKSTEPGEAVIVSSLDGKSEAGCLC